MSDWKVPMSSRNAPFVLSLALLIAGWPPAHADQLVIKDGFGEEVRIQDGWFGRRNTVIQDRLGDKYVQKKGWFGGKETEINLLGNKLKRKKGWFGRSDVEASSILGDTVTTKKGLFGNRTTTVDVSGVASAIRGLLVNQGQPAATGSGGAQSGLDESLPPELLAEPSQAVPQPTYSGQ